MYHPIEGRADMNDMVALAAPVAGLALITAGVTAKSAAEDTAKALLKKVKNPSEPLDKKAVDNLKTACSFAKSMGKFAAAALFIDRKYNRNSGK